MWTDAHRDGRQAEHRWRRLRKFRNSIPCTTPQSLTDTHCSNIGERKTWTQSEFYTGQNSTRRQESQNVYIV